MGRSNMSTKLSLTALISAGHRKSFSSSASGGRSLPGVGQENWARAASEMLFHRPVRCRIRRASVLSCVTMISSPRRRNCSRVSVKYQHASATLLSAIFDDLRSVINLRCTSTSIGSSGFPAPSSSSLIGFCIHPRNTTVLTAGSPSPVTVAS